MKYTLFFFVILCSLITNAQQNLDQIITDYEQRNAHVNDLWPMNNAHDHKQEAELLNTLLLELENLESSELTAEELINKEMLSLIMEDRLFHLSFQSHTFPLDAEGGFLTNIIYSIRGRQVNTDDELAEYVELLAALPAYFEQRMKQMRIGQLNGKSSPKLVVKQSIELIDHFLKLEEGQTFFSQITDNTAHKNTINQVLAMKVIPAYKAMRTFLAEEYLVNAPKNIGISEIKEGKVFYEQRVRYFTTFDITPQAVFDIGIDEVKRIRGEMEDIIQQLDFDGSLPDFFEFLRTDPQFYCTNPQDLLDRAAWITTKAQGKLPEYFGLLPRMPLDVVAVPAALGPNYTTGRYSPGSYENGRAGQYWVNTYNLPSRPLFVLPSLTLHEGVPGHHLQGMLAAEIDNMPRFRKYTYLSAFGEGWGLYAEHLGQEMGIYTNLYEEFGRLTYEMWRACRLVVDPGMHYMGWTREEAFDFMASNTALSLHEVNTEINRYIGWPGQAVSYKMGELKIKALRSKAETTLGDQFDIKAFHDVLLRNGSIPLNTLERIVDEWIKENS